MGIGAPSGDESRDRRIQDEINYTPALRPQMEGKRHEYERRLNEEQYKNFDDWLSDHVKISILATLRQQGVANYSHIRDGMEKAYGERFNPLIFDESWLVIQFYLGGKGDELIGGTGLA